MIKIARMLTLLILLTTVAQAQKVQPYSPAVKREYPTNVYFGDTHLHTSISLDAFGDGNTMIGPDEAYRFAKGETVIGDDGMANQMSRPLDFLMVADHSEYMGLVQGLADQKRNAACGRGRCPVGPDDGRGQTSFSRV